MVMYLKNLLKTYYENLKKYFELQKDLFVFASLFLDLHSDTILRKKELTYIYIFIFTFIISIIVQEIFRYKYNYVQLDLRQNQYYLTVILIRTSSILAVCLILLKQTFRTIFSILKGNKLLLKKFLEIQEKKLNIKTEIQILKELKKKYDKD